MAKITKTTVDGAAQKSTRYYVWDSQLIGFGLLVLPSGVRSYIYQYRTPEGRDRRLTLGKHGSLTPEQARDAAERARDQVKAGIDPLDSKKERLEAPTVAEILDAYLASEKFAGKAPSTQSIDRGRIERHLKPILGRKFAKELTPEIVKRTLSDIRTGKTAAKVRTKARGLARVTGGETTARDTIALLRAAFNWAVEERLVTGNPAATVKLGSHATRDMILDNAADYSRLFETLEIMTREKRLRPAAADAIRVIALTGARRGEIAGLKWQYVDLKRGVLTLPPLAHKTGRRTGKPRIIALPAAAQGIIARQPEGEPEEFVFEPAKGDGAMALTKIWRRIRVEAGLVEGIGLHGLRHSFASHLAMAGAEAAELMAVLGHKQLSTTGRYLHFAQDARKALAERGAAPALAGMAAAAGAPVADVVPVKR